jgi:hypothetical protein
MSGDAWERLSAREKINECMDLIRREEEDDNRNLLFTVLAEAQEELDLQKLQKLGALHKPAALGKPAQAPPSS